MKGTALFVSLLVLVACCLPGCSQKASSASAVSGKPSVLVTSSMLEEMACEICSGGDDAPVTIQSLVPPGSCPGHFDLSPRVRPALENAALVIRHDFQGALDDRIAKLASHAPEVLAVESKGGLLIPDRYAALAGRVAACLGKRFPERRESFETRVAALAERVKAAGRDAHSRAERWSGRKVIASLHQRAFAEWLGLEVIGEMARPEDVSPRELERLMALKPEAIVANLQEGTQAAEALGQRLGVPVIVFSNFPNSEGYGRGYGELLSANMDRLDRAWAKP